MIGTMPPGPILTFLEIYSKGDKPQIVCHGLDCLALIALPGLLYSLLALLLASLIAYKSCSNFNGYVALVCFKLQLSSLAALHLISTD